MDSDLATRLAAAAPLAERLHGTDAIEGDAPAASARLDRWRGREPFTDPRHWAARLAAEGIDETLLRRLLAESPRSLGARLDPPEWGAWIDDDADVPVVTGEQNPFFAPVAGRLVYPAVDDVRRALTDLGKDHEVAPFDVEPVVTRLADELLWVVHAMMGRTMALRLALSRARGDLTADDAAGRFDQFMTMTREPGGRRDLFAEHPVLARQLTIAVTAWRDNTIRLARRIVADADDLARTFHDGTPLGTVTAIEAGAGDGHRGGQSVAIVHWGDTRIVYKPRSLAVDVRFARLIAWCNDAGLTLPLRAVRCLDRGDHGWAEYVARESCADADAVHRFYRRQGSLLAILGLLRANDMHAENLIAAGEVPVLVDVETLLQPRLPDDNTQLTPAERLAHTAAAESLLQTGLLPTPVWVNRDGDSVDLSGIGHRPGQRGSIPVPVLTGLGTDTMRVAMDRIDLDTPDHRPVDEDAELHLLDYADDLAAGYEETHRLLRDRRAELSADDGPLAAFAGTRVRVLLQSTIVYGTLLRTGFHPDVLRDGLDRERHLDFLWRRVARTPGLAAAIPAERRDLWRGDIPYFTTDPDGDVLYDSDDAPVAGLAVTPGLPAAMEALRAWDDDHLRDQVAVIRGSLAAATMNTAARFDYPRYDLPTVDGPASADALVEAAARVGDRLAADAYRDGGSAQWLGLSSQMGRNWALGPLTPDLFNGASGVALFLGELWRATGDDRYRTLAAEATVTIRRQIARGGGIGAHGMAGLPGVAYAFARLSDLLEDESLSHAADDATRTTLAETGRDGEFDVISGAAGTIAALRGVHARRPGGAATDAIRAAADHLLRTAAPQATGIGWTPGLIADNDLADRPLSGFGHGVGGIAWALGEAAALLDDDRYRRAAYDALAYETGLFDPAAKVWKDVRDPDGTATICAWCHGATGILLARLGLRDLVGDEAVTGDVAHALTDMRRRGLGLSHSLCHGDAGTIDAMLTAGIVLDRADLREEAARHAAAMLRTTDTQGYVCGLPFGQTAPSLMVGLAGIGHGFLRVADPHTVPSVLTLAVPGAPKRP
ncbi:type 2 lantibiotic biosynthesis protein LanM [Stackebrandtia albiflava]|uniref:Type 2 lantibiotic biosynthesis protein LanM n=1 Tax=Stackebrandtia albiflava TaxID=406432 RepID=A0A562VDD9_9ACTN|nr:type 2 lanthipeptide synthetase LanM family protein [Stackebrandtia albiflava]TWJ15899.1 type 2 lantibiotic biosynthesis protein LanM [Stackebrandtia albiflava]